jgi:hypothetical protein
VATRPDITAFITHEERVCAFLASVPPQRKRRLERKFPLIGETPEVEVTFCDPDVFEQLEATGLPMHRSARRSVPDYSEED